MSDEIGFNGHSNGHTVERGQRAFTRVRRAADPVELRASLAHAASARSAAGAPASEFFTPEQAADVDAIAAQIIPSDDLPGAREAGAVYFMDHSFATWAQDQREAFARGLDDLNRQANQRWPRGARFATLSSDRPGGATPSGTGR